MKYYAQRIIFYFLFIVVSTKATSQVLWQQVYKDSCPYTPLNCIEDNNSHFFLLAETAQSNCLDDKIIEIDQNGNLLNAFYFTNYQNTKLLFNKNNNSFYIFSVRGGGYYADNNYYVVSYLNQNTGTVDSLYGIFIPDCWPDISDVKMDSIGNIFISGADVYNTQNQYETYGVPFLSEMGINGNGIRVYTSTSDYPIPCFSFGKNDTIYFPSCDEAGDEDVPNISYLTKLSPDFVPLWQDTLFGDDFVLQSLYTNGQIYTVGLEPYGFYLQNFSTDKVNISIDSFSNGIYAPILAPLCDAQLFVYKLNTYYSNDDTTIFCTYNNTGKLLKRVSLPGFDLLNVQNIMTADDGNILALGSVYDSTPSERYLSVFCLAQDSLYSCKDVSPQIDFTHLVEIYPNPGYNNITIDVKDNYLPATLNVYNVIGQKMFSSTITGLNTNFNTKILTNGLYLFQVVNNSNSYLVKEIIQNH